MIKCEFENGNKNSKRHVTVAGLVIRGDEILLARRADHMMLEARKLGVPGGFVDRDETVEEAVLREVLEETGYTAKIESLFRINDNPDRANEDRQNIDFIFYMTAVKKSAEHDKESSEVSWFKLDSLPSKDEFAFDHYDSIEMLREHLMSSMELPLMYKR